MENSACDSLPNSVPVKRKRGNPAWVKGVQQTSRKGSISLPGFIDPAQRAKMLVDRLGSDEIIKLADRVSKGEIKKTKLSTQDAIIIVQLSSILKTKDGLERERLYDRTFGKVPERQINLNINVDTDPDQLSEKALEMLSRLED